MKQLVRNVHNAGLTHTRSYKVPIPRVPYTVRPERHENDDERSLTRALPRIDRMGIFN